MSVVAIREARGDDREWAARLMAGTDPWITLRRNYDACLAACSGRDDTLLIGEAGGERCGLVLVRPRGVAGAPYIVSIAVSEAFRSQGVGELLVAHVEALFRGRARHLFLCVSSFNPRALAFYQRIGFAQVGELPDFIITGASERLMCKPLLARG